MMPKLPKLAKLAPELPLDDNTNFAIITAAKVPMSNRPEGIATRKLSTEKIRPA